MNLSEFKAWFEGFTENIDGEPNAKQWAKIKARVGEITKEATPYPVYIDRYRPFVERWYYQNGLSGIGASSTMTYNSTAGQNAVGNSVTLRQFDAGAAFRDLGRADADAVSAA